MLFFSFIYRIVDTVRINLPLFIFSLIAIFVFTSFIIYFDIPIIENRLIHKQATKIGFYGRLSAISDFTYIANENILIPFSYSYIYIDNMYAFMWSISLIFLFIFVTYMLSIIIRNLVKGRYDDLIFHLTLLVCMISTNILYTWPTSYLFWMLIAYISLPSTLYEK